MTTTPKPIDDGGPAFPVVYQAAPGMSLRDWLAGQALVGMSGRYLDGYTESPGDRGFNSQLMRSSIESEYDPAWIVVEACYELADNMLVKKNKDRTDATDEA